MTVEEEQFIEQEVKVSVMPEIKSLIPGFIGIILRLIFPRMEKRVADKIKIILKALLSSRENELPIQNQPLRLPPLTDHE